VTLI
jgi:hypothetical protein